MGRAEDHDEAEVKGVKRGGEFTDLKEEIRSAVKSGLLISFGRVVSVSQWKNNSPP